MIVKYKSILATGVITIFFASMLQKTNKTLTTHLQKPKEILFSEKRTGKQTAPNKSFMQKNISTEKSSLQQIEPQTIQLKSKIAPKKTYDCSTASPQKTPPKPSTQTKPIQNITPLNEFTKQSSPIVSSYNYNYDYDYAYDNTETNTKTNETTKPSNYIPESAPKPSAKKQKLLTKKKIQSFKNQTNKALASKNKKEIPSDTSQEFEPKNAELEKKTLKITIPTNIPANHKKIPKQNAALSKKSIKPEPIKLGSQKEPQNTIPAPTSLPKQNKPILETTHTHESINSHVPSVEKNKLESNTTPLNENSTTHVPTETATAPTTQIPTTESHVHEGIALHAKILSEKSYAHAHSIKASEKTEALVQAIAKTKTLQTKDTNTLLLENLKKAKENYQHKMFYETDMNKLTELCEKIRKIENAELSILSQKKPQGTIQEKMPQTHTINPTLNIKQMYTPMYTPNKKIDSIFEQTMPKEFSIHKDITWSPKMHEAQQMNMSMPMMNINMKPLFLLGCVQNLKHLA